MADGRVDGDDGLLVERQHRQPHCPGFCADSISDHDADIGRENGRLGGVAAALFLVLCSWFLVRAYGAVISSWFFVLGLGLCRACGAVLALFLVLGLRLWRCA